MMKKNYNLLAGGVVLAALLTSCTQELENPEVDITSVRCRISQIDVEEDFATGILDTLTATKASFSGTNFIWSLGDRIGIVPNTGSQIYFAVNDGAGTSTAAFDGGDWAMKSTGTFYAYYPLYPDIFLSKDHVTVSYSGQTQNGNNNNLHTGDFWTLYTGGTTAVGNALNFSFNHLTSFFKTYVTVPAGTYTKITFSAPSEVFIKDGYFDLSAQTPTIVGTTMTDELTLNLQNVTFASETELTGYLVLAPVDITGIPITVTVYKDGTATYEYTLTKASPMIPAKTYAFRATDLTLLASSPSQANALFASGATAVTITEPLTADATVVLPDTGEAVTLILPTTASSSKLTVSYDPGASSYPATLSITGPEGADLDIQTPNSTVTVNGVAYDQITSRTAANTCVIPAGVTVSVLKVLQGGVQVYGTVSQIDLSEQEDDAIISVSGTVTTLLGEDDEEYTPATGVSVNLSSIDLTIGDTESLTAIVAPVGAYPYVLWTSSDNAIATVSSTGVVTAVAEGSANITAKTISGGFTAACVINVGPMLEYVDLGLSVMWSTCNLCESGLVSSPEVFGDYYAWGETEPYYEDGYAYSYSPVWKSGKSSGYDDEWETYKWCSSPGTLSKYNNNNSYGTVDNKMVLDLEDDAAHVKLGGAWRMPTNAEWQELIDNCTWTWTTLNGVNGRLVRSTIEGFTDKSIFLPAGGYRVNTFRQNYGLYGEYWSSSLSTYPLEARFLILSNNTFRTAQESRFYGNVVRPVYAPVSSISLDKTTMSLYEGREGQLAATVLPDNAADKNVIWSSSNTSIATVNSSGKVVAVNPGNAIITARTNDGGLTATCSVTVAPDPAAVDMGLSVKWANYNLSEDGFVSSSEEYGDFYAWGETSTKSDFSWENYKWSNGSYDSLTKYNVFIAYGIRDNKTVLEPEDDVAHVKLGGAWRMPTNAEWQELIENCTWTWTYLHGVYGRLATSNINGASIFLPPAGAKVGTELVEVGTQGNYWASDISSSVPSSAWLMYFYSSNIERGINPRHAGVTVRPVLD